VRTVFDHRAFRSGTIPGGLTFLTALGVCKDFMALFSGEREGVGTVQISGIAIFRFASMVWVRF
jgi:hypothetical protein